MEFNKEKFQLIRYGVNQDIKNQSEYKTKSNKEIPQTNDVKDLGIVMADNLTFSNHHQISIAKVRQRSGWVLRVFETREKSPMLTFQVSYPSPNRILLYPYILI